MWDFTHICILNILNSTSSMFLLPFFFFLVNNLLYIFLICTFLITFSSTKISFWEVFVFWITLINSQLIKKFIGTFYFYTDSWLTFNQSKLVTIVDCPKINWNSGFLFWISSSFMVRSLSFSLSLSLTRVAWLLFLSFPNQLSWTPNPSGLYIGPSLWHIVHSARAIL